MESIERILYNRRTFLWTSIGLPTGFLLAINEPVEAQAWHRFVKFVGRATVIGRTLLITEIVLGTLKAFDIDIAGSVESMVRGYMNNDYPRYANAQGIPAYERQISRGGYCSSGSCQIGKYGFITRQNRRDADALWTPSISMWAGTGEETLISKNKKDFKLDLEDTRCGYPVTSWKHEPRKEGQNGGYTLLTQQFQKGATKIVIDHSQDETVENIYLKNQHEEVWLPA